MIFLEKPADIRKELHKLQGSGRLDIAVAFIGPDWSNILSQHTGELRVVCWLSSTNTNPYAVDALRKRRRTTVRQRDRMHCKVYLAPQRGAIVGSANLSKPALNESDTAGQDEAAVFISEIAPLRKIGAWFDAMWDDDKTAPVRNHDIARAKLAYCRAKAALEDAGIESNASKTRPLVTIPPVPRKFPKNVLGYAEEVRAIDLRDEIRTQVEQVGAVEPSRLTNIQRHELIDLIISWTKHPGVYKRIRRQPLRRFRRGIDLLFDESIDLQSRLERIFRKEYLAGLQMPTVSLLLYWRYPEICPPFNFRTLRFLRDFRMSERGVSDSSPRTYTAWLRWATRLQQALDLPSAGHVDRMVEKHYEKFYAKS